MKTVGNLKRDAIDSSSQRPRRSWLCGMLALIACVEAKAPEVAAARRVTAKSIHVRLTVPAEPTEPLVVELTGRLASESRVTVGLATGVVGAYQTFDFVPYLRDLAAFDSAGNELPSTPVGPAEWMIDARPNLSRLSYEIDTLAAAVAIDDMLAVTRRRPGHAMVSGYGVFLLVRGMEAAEHVVTLQKPAGWRVAWSLPRDAAGRYRARSGFELLDEPIMIGDSFRSRKIVGSAHDRFLHLWSEGGGANILLDVLEQEARASARGIAALGFPPLDRPYHIFFEVFEPAADLRLGWALEHGFSFHGVLEKSRLEGFSIRNVYHIIHHELHAYLPRRLYTDRLHPLRQLAGEITDYIWFAEGFAQYLAYGALSRSGVADTPATLRGLARRFVPNYVARAPADGLSLCEQSRVLARGDHEFWFWEFSAGGLFALWLDEQLHAREGGPGLLAVILELYRKWSEHPQGIPEELFEREFSKAAGLDVEDLFRRYVHGHVPLPVDGILSGAGIVREGERFRVIPEADLLPGVRRFRASAFGSGPE